MFRNLPEPGDLNGIIDRASFEDEFAASLHDAIVEIRFYVILRKFLCDHLLAEAHHEGVHDPLLERVLNVTPNWMPAIS